MPGSLCNMRTKLDPADPLFMRLCDRFMNGSGGAIHTRNIAHIQL